MRTIARIVVFVLLMGAALLVPVDPASACSCFGLTDEQAFELADAVFVGDLIETRKPESGGLFRSNAPKRFVFTVDEVLKGQVYQTQSVVTAASGAGCGLELPVDGPYLLFTSDNDPGLFGDSVHDGELVSGLCSGSRSLGPDEPLAFGTEILPLPGSSPISNYRSIAGVETRWIAVGIGALALAIGGAVTVRRRTSTQAK